MRVELADMGRDVAFVAINAGSAAGHQGELAERCAFPLLQDLEGGPVWGLLGGAKDDIYVFDSQGKLSTHLANGGDVDTNLSEPAGYQNVLQAVLAAE